MLEIGLRPGRPFVRVRDRDGVELAPSSEVRQRLAEEERRRAVLEEMVQRLRAQIETQRD